MQDINLGWACILANKIIFLTKCFHNLHNVLFWEKKTWKENILISVAFIMLEKGADTLN